MIRALPRVALQLWIVLYIVFFGAEVIHLEPTLRIITQILYGVPLVAWGLWRLRGPADRLDWAILGCLVIFAAVCLVSRDRTESLGALGLAAAYATWFMLMRRAGELRSTDRRRHRHRAGDHARVQRLAAHPGEDCLVRGRRCGAVRGRDYVPLGIGQRAAGARPGRHPVRRVARSVAPADRPCGDRRPERDRRRSAEPGSGRLARPRGCGGRDRAPRALSR